VQFGHEPNVDAGSRRGLRHARSAHQQRRRAALYRKYCFNEEDRRSYYTVNGEDALSMTTDWIDQPARRIFSDAESRASRCRQFRKSGYSTANALPCERGVFCVCLRSRGPVNSCKKSTTPFGSQKTEGRGV
jgi:hypothetical protein